MFEFFDKVNKFIDLARVQSVEAADAGADILERAAQYLRDLAKGLSFADGGDSDKQAAEAEKALKALRKELTPKKGARRKPVGDHHEVEPKKVDPATIIMIVELVLKFVEMWRKRRNPA